METKLFSIKEISEKGTGSAVIATLNVIDFDGDVTRPGAFGNQETVIVPTHDWHSVPLGKAVLRESKTEAIADFKFNLDSPTAKEWHSALKFDLENGKPLTQWSYGYDAVKESKGQFEDREVRFLEGLKVHEISPLILGAGINTRTLAIKDKKGLKLEDHFEQVESALVETRTVFERMKAIASMREKEGRDLSLANRERLERLLKELGVIHDEMDTFLKEANPDTRAGLSLFSRYETIKTQLRGHLT